MTAGPASPGTGPSPYQPAVTASAGTSILPVGVRPRWVRPVVCTPMAGTSRIFGVASARTTACPVVARPEAVGSPPHPTAPVRSRAASSAQRAAGRHAEPGAAGRWARSAIDGVATGVHAAGGDHLDLLVRRAEAVLAGDAVVVGVEVVRVLRVGIQGGLRVGLRGEVAAVAVVAARTAGAGATGRVVPRARAAVARRRRGDGGGRGRGRRGVRRGALGRGGGHRRGRGGALGRGGGHRRGRGGGLGRRAGGGRRASGSAGRGRG